MKILIVGDPHGSFKKVKEVPDVILLTGDLGSSNLARKMAFENVERKRNGLPKKEYSSIQKKRAFMEAYNSTIKLVKYFSSIAPVYIIYSNVESSNAETRKKSKEIKLPLPSLTDKLNSMKNVYIINNKVANFHGIKIGGLEYFVETGWVKRFSPRNSKKMAGAKKETDKARKFLKNLGYVDLLLCHQPPYGILDKVSFSSAPKSWIGKHAGSELILDYIKKCRPRYVFCGHIHEGRGEKKIGGTKVVNLGAGGGGILDME